MSEWTYIGIAYGLTWVTFVAYGLMLRARRRSLLAAAGALSGASSQGSSSQGVSSQGVSSHGRVQP